MAKWAMGTQQHGTAMVQQQQHETLAANFSFCTQQQQWAMGNGQWAMVQQLQLQLQHICCKLRVFLH
ncbi:hypothetical protein U1Q18_015588 [Sarracenia purpurea var. burkii]